MKTKQISGAYADLRRRVYAIKEKYPFANIGVCARSWGGRAIFTLTLGSPDDTVLYLGGINATHVKTPFALLKLFESMCNAYAENTAICSVRLNEVMKTKGITVVPCINPDGMEMHFCGAAAAGCYAGLANRLCADSFDTWRANAAGIDLLHNISEDWQALKRLDLSLGYTAPGAKLYGGKACISEPETRAFAKLCRRTHVRHIITVGEGENRICGGINSSNRQSLMLKIFSISSGVPSASFSGGAEDYNGFVNWFSAVYGRPAFSLECRDVLGSDYAGLEETAVLAAVM